MDDDKIKADEREKNLASVSNAKVSQESEKHGFSEEQLDRNLKNYIDCNNDGMVYNENMKKWWSYIPNKYNLSISNKIFLFLPYLFYTDYLVTAKGSKFIFIIYCLKYYILTFSI